MFQIGDKYYYDEPESGQIVEVSKATFDAHSSFMKTFHDQLKSTEKGKFIILSSPADNTDNSDFKNLWNEWNQKNNI